MRQLLKSQAMDPKPQWILLEPAEGILRCLQRAASSLWTETNDTGLLEPVKNIQFIGHLRSRREESGMGQNWFQIPSHPADYLRDLTQGT